MNFPKVFAKMVGYDSVDRRDRGRNSVPRETRNEDQILTISKRAQLVATQRDAFRNTTFSPATALQLQVNVIGNEGGKLAFSTEDDAFNEEAGKVFRRWARHCSFTDGVCLNEMLQLLLVQLTHNGGDFIAVFDDGCLTGGRGSGKIRVFETDEIKPVNDAVFNDLYHDGEVQSNGLVYDKFGRLIAAFVSSAGREKDVFGSGEFLHLRLNTPGEFDDANWIFVANRWRVNQGRGISTSTHVSNLLQDLADTQGSEVQAAKLNAGLGIVVTEPAADSANLGVSREWLDEGGGQTSSDSDADADAAENAALKTAATKLQAGESAIVKLASGKSLESFKTDRPNLNTVEFIGLQRKEAGTVYGLGPSYTTLEPAGSYTAFRGEMVMAEKAFARLRKKLERDFLDWVAVRVIVWSGIAAPEDFSDSLAWLWPSMVEVDEGTAQKAIEMQFTNGLTTLQRLNGTNWKKVADQQATEKAYFDSLGLTYPASRTVSGGVIENKQEQTEVKNDR